MLPLVEFFDSFNSNLLVGIAFTFVALPSVIIIAMTIVINKVKIKKLIRSCYFKWRYLRLRRRNYEALPLDDNPETPSSDNGTRTTDM